MRSPRVKSVPSGPVSGRPRFPGTINPQAKARLANQTKGDQRHLNAAWRHAVEACLGVSENIVKDFFNKSYDNAVKMGIMPITELQLHGDVYAPVIIKDEDSDIGPRIGGKAPRGVKPPFVKKGVEYLATIPWLKSQELSLFIWLSAEPSKSNCTWNNSRTLHSSSNPLVQIVIHPPSTRSRSSAMLSSLTSHILEIRRFRPESEISMNHKMGGRPYFNDAGSYCHDMTARLMNEGFLHVLQLTFPTTPPDGRIDGNWPFGEYIFQLFASLKPNVEFKYLWEL